jgi:hypothetical protein
MKINVSIELRRPSWLRWTPRGYRGLALTLALVLTLSLPTGVFASDRFSDVPTDSIFHNNINAIAGAGITQGCGVPNFCPTANVNREQMAAFLHRGLGRSAHGSVGVATATTTLVDLSVITIKAGEAMGGTVWISLEGFVLSYTTNVTGCPCQTEYWIFSDTAAGIGDFIGYNQIATLGSSGYALDTGSTGARFAMPSGATQTFRLQARKFGGADHSLQGQLFATMTPFGSQGTSAR